MKKIYKIFATVLAIICLPVFSHGQINIQGGGTGTSTLPNSYIPYGGTKFKIETNSGFTFSSSTNNAALLTVYQKFDNLAPPVVTTQAIKGTGAQFNGEYFDVGNVEYDAFIFPYRLVGTQKIFGSSYGEGDIVTGNTGLNLIVQWTWPAVSGVDGYRIFLYDPYATGSNFDHYYDTSSTTANIGQAGTSFAGSIVAGSQPPTPTLPFFGMGRLGLGSTTPGTSLGIGTSTNYSINLNAYATSTFSKNVNLLTGCLAINGTCFAGSAGFTYDGGNVISLGGGLTATTFTIQNNINGAQSNPLTISTRNVSGGSAGINLTTGNATSGGVGAITLTGGNGVNVQGGNIVLMPGTGLTNGNVGIGTTTPYAPLSVVGKGGVVAASFTATSTTDFSSIERKLVIGNNTGRIASSTLEVFGTTNTIVLNATSSTATSSIFSTLSIGTSSTSWFNDNEVLNVVFKPQSNSTYNSLTNCGVHFSQPMRGDGAMSDKTSGLCFGFDNQTNHFDGNPFLQSYFFSVSQQIAPLVLNPQGGGLVLNGHITGSNDQPVSVVGNPTNQAYLNVQQGNGSGTHTGITFQPASSVSTAGDYTKGGIDCDDSGDSSQYDRCKMRFLLDPSNSNQKVIGNETADTVFMLGYYTGNNTASALTNPFASIASTSPSWGTLGVEMGTNNPAFVVSHYGSTTPSFIVTGVNQNGIVAVGSSTPNQNTRFTISGQVGDRKLLAVASSTATSVDTLLFTVDNKGHKISSGPSPTMGTCGTNPAVQGDDSTMRVTAGSGVLSSCIVNFASSWTKTDGSTTVSPACHVEDTAATALAVDATSTPSTVTFSGTSLTSATFIVMCQASDNFPN